MKLIQQALLAFQGGNSDKVYEVDLCEVGTDQYVVNFRYGRRGSTLQEGSKTPLPVNRAKAEKVFNSLVQGKLKKGYYDTQAGIVDAEAAAVDLPEAEPLPELVAVSDPRKQAVLQRLINHLQPAAANKGLLSRLTSGKQTTAEPKTKWSFDRIIWRAGVLRMPEAEPYLLRLLDPKDHERNYCVIYALGRCGSEQSIPVLQRFYDTKGTPEMLRRLAGEALYQCCSENEREQFQAERFAALPESVQTALQTDLAALQTAVDEHLQAGKVEHYAVLTQLYQFAKHDAPADSPAQRAQRFLLALLAEVPLKPSWFKQIRHIFKLAEYRDDAAMFALLAYRFEKSGAMFTRSPWGGASFIDENQRYQYFNDDDLTRQLGSAKSKLAYSHQTRQYLRRRVWRTLRHLGELESAHYVEMASQILLSINDSDAQAPVSNSVGRSEHVNGRWQYLTYTTHYGAFAAYWSFNHILYHNSPRFEPSPLYKWRYKGEYRAGMPAPEGVIEEAFPELWRQAPEALLQLLIHSRCVPVHEFAAKALGDCPEFCQNLPLSSLFDLLQSPYEATAKFAFRFVQDRYTPEKPQAELVLAALSCVAPEVRAAAQQWVQQGRLHFLQDSAFLAAFINNEHADTRAFAEQFLRSASLNDTVAQALLARLVGELLALPAEQSERAADSSRILRQTLGPQLRLLSLPVLADLLQAPALPVREFAAEILLNFHEPEQVPEAVLHSLLEAEHDSLRSFGMRIFSRFSDAYLTQRAELLAVLAARPHAEVRSAAVDIIRRLLPNHAAFGQQMTVLCVSRLLSSKIEQEGASTLVHLFKDCRDYWTTLETNTVWRLLRSRLTQAQEVGGLLLPILAKPEDFSVKQWVKLADHEILSIRQAAQQMCLAQLPRLRDEMAVTVKLLDCHWEDSRQFAFNLFSEQFSKDDLTPTVLVSICDSVRPEVQQFGRKLLTQYFADADGEEYLLKLSEHPTSDMQLFASNYLEQYACDNPQRLAQLTPFFLAVLNKVNKGRIAKQRIYHFLESEAVKSLSAAQTVAPILARQSVSMAIGDKAAAIRIMSRIQQQFPEVELPLRQL